MNTLLELAESKVASFVSTPTMSEPEWVRTENADAEVQAAATVFVGAPRSLGVASPNSALPPAIERLQPRLLALQQLRGGWDSYGAPPVSSCAFRTAVSFLAQARSEIDPSIVPTGNGGLQIEWHDGTIDVEIECLPSGYARLRAEKLASDRNEERWVVPGHPSIDSWLQLLRSEG